VIRIPALFVVSVVAAFGQQVSFDRDIRPIMSDTCFRCHGPDASSRMANMRLDLREEALKPKPHGTPIVPGDTEHSEIIQRIFAKDGRVMPPPFAHKELTETQKQTIRRWVEQGAKYEIHWSYVPVNRPQVPNIPGVANPIDAFIQARLAQDGLKPSPEADRRTLIRRVMLDLTGLAPKPAEIAAFVSDNAPDAYEKLVDRLLASPAYAEKQAVRWLDAVRYADTAGYHGDVERPAWPYRDYVLDAFRDNKPFDVFTREQLAGDLMPNATVEQKIASAYNRMGRTSAEGGLQPKEYLAKYGAERVRTVSTNWLGTTMGCSECHNHKFDPVLTKDFYSMKAFFADVKETGLVPDFGPDAFAPKMPVYNPGQKERIDALKNQIQSEKSELDRKADAMATERTHESQPCLGIERGPHAPVPRHRQGPAPVMGDPGLRRSRKRLTQRLAQPLVDTGILLVLGGDRIRQQPREGLPQQDLLGLLGGVGAQRAQLRVGQVSPLAQEERHDVHFRQRRIRVERV